MCVCVCKLVFALSFPKRGKRWCMQYDEQGNLYLQLSVEESNKEIDNKMA